MGNLLLGLVFTHLRPEEVPRPGGALPLPALVAQASAEQLAPHDGDGGPGDAHAVTLEP